MLMMICTVNAFRRRWARTRVSTRIRRIQLAVLYVRAVVHGRVSERAGQNGTVERNAVFPLLSFFSGAKWVRTDCRQVVVFPLQSRTLCFFFKFLFTFRRLR